MVREVFQYEVYWVNLNPTQGGEMANKRPCVIVSPPELNMYLSTVVVAPITSTVREYTFRLNCDVAGREGQIAVDQIMTIDKKRISNKLGKISRSEKENLRETLRQMLCE